MSTNTFVEKVEEEFKKEISNHNWNFNKIRVVTRTWLNSEGFPVGYLKVFGYDYVVEVYEKYIIFEDERYKIWFEAEEYPFESVLYKGVETEVLYLCAYHDLGISVLENLLKCAMNDYIPNEILNLKLEVLAIENKKKGVVLRIFRNTRAEIDEYVKKVYEYITVGRWMSFRVEP